MAKLISLYRDIPTLAHAVKVCAYGKKHPFAVCMLTADDVETYKHALRHVLGS